MVTVQDDVECWLRPGEGILDMYRPSKAARVDPFKRSHCYNFGDSLHLSASVRRNRAHSVDRDQCTVPGACADKVLLIGGKNALPDYCAIDVVVPGNLSPRPDQRRCRSAGRQHRYQHAVISRTRSSAGLPRLLRASSEFELLLLRRPVLGVPAGQLVFEQLVQRSVAVGGANGCATVCAAHSCALLPRASCVFS